MAHVCFVKCGNIATSVVVDLLLDEIAARDNLQFTVVGSGPKMTKEETERIAKLVPDLSPDLVVICGPNAGAAGMVKLREAIKDLDVPKIVIGDGPSKKVKAKLEADGIGYLIMDGDPLIGARREFLDPTEMAIFNADVLKALAITGSFRVVQQELDACIASLGTENVYLPMKVVTQASSLAKAGFSNPYARAKAAGAFELLAMSAKVNAKACFAETDMKKYIRLAATAHELAREAAVMADEAREIEKSSDKVLRTPHARSGKSLRKRALMKIPEESK